MNIQFTSVRWGCRGGAGGLSAKGLNQEICKPPLCARRRDGSMIGSVCGSLSVMIPANSPAVRGASPTNGIDRRSVWCRAGSAFSSVENLKPAEVSVKTISSAFLNNFFSQGEEGIGPV